MSDQSPYSVDVRKLDEFSARELYALLKLRVDVFVVEQECAYAELDGRDESALHLRLMQSGDLMAAARILPPADGNAPRIGRVVVSPDHRGKHLGHALMREALSLCHLHFPEWEIAISAQSYLLEFYSSLGFVRVSEEYVEDGIPHIDMVRSA